MSAIQAYFKSNATFQKTGFAQLPLIRCADGFEMSVQASRFHYCTPRETLKSGNYDAWEIGFPSAKEEALLPYIDDGDKDPTDTVYGYVPTELVDAVLEKHGGIAA